MPGLLISRTGMLPHRQGLLPARGCSSTEDETDIPSCGPCVFPHVPDFVTVSLPDCTLGPDLGSECEPCLQLNGATVVMPHVSGNPSNCVYNLVIGTCIFGPGDGQEHEVRVSATLTSFSSVIIRADVTTIGVFPESKLAISWFRGSLTIGPNCFGFSASIPNNGATTNGSYGCEARSGIGDAFISI